MARSKRADSMPSLLKYLTVSKLSRLSTALPCASWSDSFMARRIEIRQSLARTVNQT
jgi:hypothetical protein